MAEALDRLLWRLLRFNPAVAWHELRLRMRVGRAFVLLALYVVLASLAVVVPVWFAVWEASQYPGSTSPTDLGRIGLYALAYVQLTLLVISLPAYAASTIAAEKEKQTLEMLRATLLTPGDLVSGKMLSVLAFGLMLLVITLPVAAWCLLLGGVSPTEVFRIYMLTIATAGWVTALGVAMSAHYGKSLGAIVATYAAMLGMGLLTAGGAYAGSVSMMVGRSSSSGIGAAVAVIAGLIAVLLTTNVLASLAWGALRRVLPRLIATTGVPTLVLIIIFGFVVAYSLPLIEMLADGGSLTLLLVNPFVAVAAMMDDQLVQHMLQYSSGGLTPPSPAGDLSGKLYSILMWLYLVAAAGLWILAIRIHARRAES